MDLFQGKMDESFEKLPGVVVSVDDISVVAKLEQNTKIKLEGYIAACFGKWYQTE